MSTMNNSVLRSIRYAFDLGDDAMIAIFAHTGMVVTRAEVSDWLKQDDDPAYKACPDVVLAGFLNGLITEKRGRREGPTRDNEQELTNNQILTKLKIALAFSGDDVMAALNMAGYHLSKHELSALFRKPNHKHYRKCMDQILRYFLRGVQLRLRPDAEGAG